MAGWRYFKRSTSFLSYVVHINYMYITYILATLRCHLHVFRFKKLCGNETGDTRLAITLRSRRKRSAWSIVLAWGCGRDSQANQRSGGRKMGDEKTLGQRVSISHLYVARRHQEARSRWQHNWYHIEYLFESNTSFSC